MVNPLNLNKEFEIEVNTEEGQIAFSTDELKDYLDSIIILSDQKIDIVIESELGYLILSRKQIIGTNYYSIRNRTTTPIEDLRDFPNHVPFNLNEKLNIIVIGPKNTDVKILLRFS